MKKDLDIEYEFAKFAPKELEERKIYVSVEYATSVHRCFCGCGSKVVMPISPANWQLTFDGETVSFRPSVGNWSFKCRSHYWITRNKVVWAGDMSDEQVVAVRANDRAAREAHFGRIRESAPPPIAARKDKRKRGFWHRLFGRP
jgi:hypothetical protein